MKELDVLLKERDKLEKSLVKIKNQIYRLKIPKYRAELEKKYIDTYWTFPSNYGADEKWIGYVHIKAVFDIWLTSWGAECRMIYDSLEERSGGEIVCKIASKEFSPSIICKTKITKAAYERKKAAILKKIQGI